MAYAVFVDGIEDIFDLDGLPETARRAMVLSVNHAVRKTRTRGARDIRDQVNLPARYLSPSAGNLTVSQLATTANVEARIKAKGRATSLARYVKGNPRRGQPITVEVAPGRAKRLKRAFLINLRRGNTGELGNRGLAIRLGPGEKIYNKYSSVKVSSGLYLLYGPSVQQVFIDNTGEGVAQDLEPFALDDMEAEFNRLLATSGIL